MKEKKAENSLFGSSPIDDIMKEKDDPINNSEETIRNAGKILGY